MKDPSWFQKDIKEPTENETKLIFKEKKIGGGNYKNNLSKLDPR